MTDRISVRVFDILLSETFYDIVLSLLGYKRLPSSPAQVGYQAGAAEFWIVSTPEAVPDIHAAPPLYFSAQDSEAVNRFYYAALQAGGANKVPPVIRSAHGVLHYTAHVTDPDGYRLEATCRYHGNQSGLPLASLRNRAGVVLDHAVSGVWQPAGNDRFPKDIL